MTDITKPIPNLSDEQTINFVKNLLLGRASNEAARLAGFPQPRVAAVRLLNDPAVLDAIEKAVSGRMRGELAPKALNNLAEILDSKSASRALKLAASKAVLDRAGHVPPKAPDSVGDPAKGISERSPEQLRQFIQQAQNELASRAKPVIDAEVVKPATKEQRGQKSLPSPTSDADELEDLLG
jgi:hypothetical protein